MLPAQQFQQLLSILPKLDEKALIVLEETLNAYLKEEEKKLTTLRAQIQKVKNLRTTVTKEDQKKIGALKTKIGIPS